MVMRPTFNHLAARSAVPTLAVLCLLAAAPASAAPRPKYRVAKYVSLATRHEPPTFVCLDGLLLLDRGKLVQIGRPVEKHNVFTVLDLVSLEVRDLTVPDVPGTQVPPKTEMAVDRPLFYDTANGTAGVLMRAGGLVSGDAEYAEWDLSANRITRRLPLAAMAGAKWMSVAPIGYDPVRREAYVEIVRYGVRLKTSPNRGGHFDLTVLAVGERVREVASFTTRRKLTSKGPYFDPARRRSMHIEYAEYAGNTSAAYLVDLDSGAVKTYELPPVVYGFAFDPDGRTGYVYSFRDSNLLKLDLATGTLGPKKRVGSHGHLVDFVAPDLLLLGRNHGMHFIDARTLRERWFLDPKDFHGISAHLEGSMFMPGRALVRIFYELYVLDFFGKNERPVPRHKPEVTISPVPGTHGGREQMTKCLPAETVIATPAGDVAVGRLSAGDAVWTRDPEGGRVPGVVLRVGRVPTMTGHRVVRVVLRDGRTVTASVGHPLPDGRGVESLRAGDALDGSIVDSALSETFIGAETFDLLPSGPTALYWANGIPLQSTLPPPGR